MTNRVYRTVTVVGAAQVISHAGAYYLPAVMAVPASIELSISSATVYAGLLDGEEQAALTLNPARKVYVHLIRGELQVNGQALKGGDAALIQAESNLELTHGVDAEVLVFDLASQ